MSTEPVDRVWEGVEGRLLGKSWATLEARRLDPSCAGVLCLPLKEGFAATMRVLDRVALGDQAGQLMVYPVGVVGLDYEPARKLTLALTGSARSGVVLKEPTLPVALTGDHGIAEATDSLVRFAAEQVPSLARFADVDTLIEMLQNHLAVAAQEAPAVLHEDQSDRIGARSPRLPYGSLELIPALLAGAERCTESRDFLAEHYPPGWQESARPHSRRFVRQLRRWADNDGRFALPTTPAHWPPEHDWRSATENPSASFLEMLAETWPVVKARRSAVTAVRTVSHGKTRDELRTLLTDEMRKREVDMEPGNFEQTIDMLATEREPFGRARVALRAFATVRDLRRSGASGKPILNALSDRNDKRLNDRQDPAWMQTPERAAYPILGFGPETAAVQLEPAAGPSLAEALHEGEPDAAQMRFVDVWLAADDAPIGASRLSVHIGPRHVGYLNADVTTRLRAAIEAAAERDEDARATANLSRLPGDGHYVLALLLPGERFKDPTG